eukprot:5567747-Heterocapsa_arctica.AAC.1
MPFSRAAMAFFRAAMFVSSSDFSVAKAAASFSRSAVAEAMAASASARLVWCSNRSASVWVFFDFDPSIAAVRDSILAVASATLVLRSPPEVLQ